MTKEVICIYIHRHARTGGKSDLANESNYNTTCSYKKNKRWGKRPDLTIDGKKMMVRMTEKQNKERSEAHLFAQRVRVRPNG